MSETTNPNWFTQWDIDATAALGYAVKFDQDEVVLGHGGGVAFYFHDSISGDWFSPYYNQSASEQETDPDGGFYPSEYEQAESDPDEWLSGMYDATDWSEWEWSRETDIPMVY